MDKEWMKPTINEVDVKETAYGGTVVREADNVFQNDKGNWEATFVKDPS